MVCWIGCFLVWKLFQIARRVNIFFWIGRIGEAQTEWMFPYEKDAFLGCLLCENVMQ